MHLKRSSDGHTNLFIWREGEEYYRQKSEIFMKEFTAMKFDLAPQSPDSVMIFHDVTKPLPFANGSFDHIYCYHVYEHLFHKEADRFSAELHRILKPGGILRVSTPDMEMIAEEYLKYLEAALQDPSEANLKRYRWTVMKMIEQSIREKTGGLMLEAMKEGQFDKEYVKNVFGESYASFFERKPLSCASAGNGPRKSLLQRIFSLTPQKIERRMARSTYQKNLHAYKSGLGSDARRNKELVTLLPDRLYLKFKLEKQGFVNFSVKDYKSSDIVGWDKYDLDRSNNGDYAYDPSVYVEVRK